jgi:hypothetical protein
MEDKIYYVGFYSNEINKTENRISSSAAVNLMSYVAESLSFNKNVEIISCSWTLNKQGFYKSKKFVVSKNINFYTSPSIGGGLKTTRVLSKIISIIWLTFFLIFKVEKGRKVIVYHSIAYLFPVIIAKKIKGFKLILQVNEIYQNVSNIGKINTFLEKYILGMPNAFIFSTVLLNAKINKNNLPFLICGGVYKMNQKLVEKFDDKKIHLVYAGLIDKVKLGGAFISVDLAKYLPENYIIHIVGFGTEEDINDIIKLINENNKINCAKVVFEGELLGDDFFRFLQQCHIGLALQMPERMFNETSFPSKIFSYLTNYLPVVSLHNNSICSSPIADLLYLYKKNDLQEISNLIMKINSFDSLHNPNKINELDLTFKFELINLIKIV